MNSEQNGATAHTPEISEQMLENKIEELIADLEGRDSRQKQRLIYSIEQIMTIQRSYRTLCRDFAEIAAHSQNFMSIDIVVSPGAIKNCYLNLRDAILSGMVEKEEEIQIEFPGTGLLPVAATVKLSGTIQGRKVFKPFFTAMRVTAGDVIRFAMNGAEKTFTITVIDPDQKVRSGPLLPPTNRRQPFTFSEKDSTLIIHLRIVDGVVALNGNDVCKPDPLVVNQDAVGEGGVHIPDNPADCFVLPAVAIGTVVFIPTRDVIGDGSDHLILAGTPTVDGQHLEDGEPAVQF